MNKAGNAIDDHAQIVFARTQGFLGALPVFNVGGNAIPANHATTVIPQRLSSRYETSDRCYRTAHTLVNITWLTGFDQNATMRFSFSRHPRDGVR